MKNKEFIFGEKRFVFDGPLDAKKPEALAGTLPEGQVPLPEGTVRDAGRASVRREAGQGLAESRTKMDLGELEKKLGADVFKEFLTATNLEGADFTLTFFSDDVNFESGPLVDGLSGRVEYEMSKKTGLEKFATYINVKPEDMEEIVTEVYVRTFLNRTKAEFDNKYPGFSDFIKEVKPSKFPIQFSIKPDKDGNTAVSFGALKEEAKYQEWKTKKGITTDTKKPEEGAKGQDSAAGKEQEAAIAEFAQTKLGKVFGALKNEEGKSLLQRLAEGGTLFGAIIAGLFGFSKASGGVWESIVEMLPAGIKEKALAAQKRARETPLSAEAQSAEGTYQNVDAKVFAEMVSKPGSIPEKGIKLTEDYSLRRGGLKVDFSDKRGGKMILPEEASLTIDGEPVKIEKGKIHTYDSNDTLNNPLLITGKIPKGTIFQGDIAFQQIASADKPKTGRDTAKAGQDRSKTADAGAGTGAKSDKGAEEG